MEYQLSIRWIRAFSQRQKRVSLRRIDIGQVSVSPSRTMKILREMLDPRASFVHSRLLLAVYLCNQTGKMQCRLQMHASRHRVGREGQRGPERRREERVGEEGGKLKSPSIQHERDGCDACYLKPIGVRSTSRRDRETCTKGYSSPIAHVRYRTSTCTVSVRCRAARISFRAGAAMSQKIPFRSRWPRANMRICKYDSVVGIVLVAATRVRRFHAIPFSL